MHLKTLRAWCHTHINYLQVLRGKYNYISITSLCAARIHAYDLKGKTIAFVNAPDSPIKAMH